MDDSKLVTNGFQYDLSSSFSKKMHFRRGTTFGVDRPDPFFDKE